MRRVFLVKGSAAEPYRVTFEKEGSNLKAYCTCPAGEHGLHCKHRVNILKGIEKGIVSENVADVAGVASWLPGSDLEEAIRVVDDLEAHASRIKKELSKAKKILARSMRD
ncbi:MAG: SWIM zinc finger family protein [Desulfobacterales bacterium]|nr:SWIM zinc finger family protein [Desulfobacterales bacterium]